MFKEFLLFDWKTCCNILIKNYLILIHVLNKFHINLSWATKSCSPFLMRIFGSLTSRWTIFSWWIYSNALMIWRMKSLISSNLNGFDLIHFCRFISHFGVAIANKISERFSSWIQKSITGKMYLCLSFPWTTASRTAFPNTASDNEFDIKVDIKTYIKTILRSTS